MKIIKLFIIILGIYAVSLLFQKNRYYSHEYVAKHTTPGDCWTIINGNVYNVTPLAKTHSGGPESILDTCGKDGSSIFNGRHGEETFPQTELETFKIGVSSK